METWVVVSVVIVAVAIVFQAAMLTAMFFQMRKTVERVDKLTNDLHSRVGPILTRVQIPARRHSAENYRNGCRRRSRRLSRARPGTKTRSRC